MVKRIGPESNYMNPPFKLNCHDTVSSKGNVREESCETTLLILKRICL
jgi:hypothetical protein